MIRTTVFSFERKQEAKGKTVVEISGTSYQAKLNRKLFEEQEFDQESLKAGEALVKYFTLDVTV